MIPTEYHEMASKLQTSEIPVDINRILAIFTDIQLEYIDKITADTPLVGKNDAKHASGLELVMDQINPDPKALEYLLEREAHGTHHELAILEGKLYCGTHEPSPLEKTMTDYELYQSGSIWWMRDLTGNNVACVYSGAEELGDKLTETDFHGLSKLHDDWDVTNYIGARKETTNGNNQSNRNDPKRRRRYIL